MDRTERYGNAWQRAVPNATKKGVKVNLKYVRTAAAVLVLMSVAACTNMQQGTVGDNQFWIKGPTAENEIAELGLAELAKGNNVGALGHFEKALGKNPNDVHALLGSALVYQNTGQPERAQGFYKRILALDPPPSDEILVWAGSRPQSITDVANVNLTLLQGGRPSPLPGKDMASMTEPTQASSSELPTSKLYVPPVTPTLSVSRLEADVISFNEADNNIVARFKSIRFLLEEGLITQNEFTSRRQANIGALLPFSKPAPAAGLERAVPPGEQIAGRLRAIGRALEMRAITVQQHSSERGVILDSLMPAVPKSKAISPARPSGLMEAADAVRRLELLRRIDVITSDEYSAERAAIEGGRASAPSSPAPFSPAARSAPSTAAPSASAAPMALSGFQPGVHLSSYRQRGAADRGWRELQKRFDSLKGLEMMVERVDLGTTRGVFFRLKAGPVTSNSAAKELCAQLKRARQYCEPTTVDFGG